MKKDIFTYEEILYSLSYNELIEEIYSIPNTLYNVSLIMLKKAEESRAESYDVKHKWLKDKWDKKFGYITSPDRGSGNEIQKWRKKKLVKLKKQHCVLKYTSLVDVKESIVENHKNDTTKFTEFAIMLWKSIHCEIMKRRSLYDDKQFGFLLELIELLALEFRLIQWVYNDKALNQLGKMLNILKMEIAKEKGEENGGL